MMKEEFEKRVGLVVTPQEYARIEEDYVALPESVDKDTFCKRWIKNGGVQTILDQRYALAERLHIEIMAANERVKDSLQRENEAVQENDMLRERIKALESKMAKMEEAMDRSRRILFEAA